LFNIFNVVSISGVVVFILINQTIWPIMSERIETVLSINNTFLNGWFLISMIYGFVTLFFFIFNIFGNISTTTQNAENISITVSESVDLVSETIVQQLSDTFAELYNQIIQIKEYNYVNKIITIYYNIKNCISIITIFSYYKRYIGYYCKIIRRFRR